MRDVVELSVIIVNWNVKDFLQKCLNSLTESISEIAHEIFVVDNNSSDGSVDMLKKEFPDVSLILNKKNVGFGKANNQAIRKSSAEYLLLLNPDTMVLEDGISRMLNYLKQNSQIGAIGPKILNPDSSVQASCLRKYPSLSGECLSLTRLERFLYKPFTTESQKRFHSPGPAEVLSGSAMLLRRDCFQEVNGFDEQFFMYAEDIDLCYQIKKKGWLVYFYPEASVKHYAHEASKKNRDFSPFTMACSSMYKYFKKNHGFLVAFSYRIMAMFASLLWILIYTFTLQFLKKKPRNQLSLYHDYHKLKWALTSKVKIQPE